MSFPPANKYPWITKIALILLAGLKENSFKKDK